MRDGVDHVAFYQQPMGDELDHVALHEPMGDQVDHVVHRLTIQ